MNLLPWFATALLIAAAYPWAAYFTPPRPNATLFALTLTLPFMTGSFTLLSFFQMLFGGVYHLPTLLTLYGLLMSSGFILWWRNGHPLPTIRPWVWTLAFVVALGIALAVLFNAAYWPFYRNDTIRIYHRYGKLMAVTGQLVPFAGRDDSFYQAYPMHLALLYTFAYRLSGWVNEYLAHALSALLSLATLPAVYLLAQRLYHRTVAQVALLLLSLTPLVVRWASAGYADLPMAFLYTLSLSALWELTTQPTHRTAVLTGLLLGLTAWTKNAALVGVALSYLWLTVALLSGRITRRHLLLVISLSLVVAAPWYLRNLALAGLVIPPTIWFDRAQPTVASVFIFVTTPEQYAVSGWLVLAGLTVSLAAVITRAQQHLKRLSPEFFLLFFTLPYFLIWWQTTSYDPRFILLFYPPLCILGAARWSLLVAGLPPVWRDRARWLVRGVVLLLALWQINLSIEFKSELIRHPLMSHAEKQQIVLAGVVLYEN